MKNELLTKGIILPSGEIGKNKINLVAGAITQPFAEMVWVTTGGDMETINRLTNVLVTMNNPTDRGKLFKIIKLLYGLMGLPFSEEAEPMDAAPDVQNMQGVAAYTKNALYGNTNPFLYWGWIWMMKPMSSLHYPNMPHVL